MTQRHVGSFVAVILGPLGWCVGVGALIGGYFSGDVAIDYSPFTSRAGDAAALLRPCPDDWLKVWPVSKAVNSVRNNAPELLEPGKCYELRIDLVATSNGFKVGHRIQLDISSSNFPRFDRNSNTGGTIASETAADFIQSVNRVFHDSSHPSHLILPIIERD